jgi:hypothetical protein
MIISTEKVRVAPDNAEVGSIPQAMNSAVAVWEIASIVLTFGIGEWVVFAFAPGSRWLLVVPVLCALTLAVYSHRQRRESLRMIGWRLDNFAQALRRLAVPTLVGVIILLSIGWTKGSLHFDRGNLWSWAFGLLIWATAQQYFLQGFINRRAQIVFGKGRTSIIIVGLLFAILHLPNPVLSLATLIGGMLWAAVYQRVPNLFALGLSHAVLSFMLAMSLPNWLLNNLRVGFKYLG